MLSILRRCCWLTAALALAGGALLAGAGGAGAAPVVSNGTFANLGGGCDGWTFTNGATCESEPGEGNPPPGALLNSDGAFGTDPEVSQAVSGFEAGVEYVVNWDFKIDFNGGGAIPPGAPTFAIFLDSFPLHLTNLVPVTYFSDTTFPFATTAGTHTLRFRGELAGSDTSYFLDNVSIAAVVPLPPALLLFGSALAGLGLLARPRRRCV